MGFLDAKSGDPQESVLLQAAYDGDRARIRTALDGGASIDCCSGGGRTPLLLAAENGHVAALDQLLGRGAKLEAADKAGWTALHYAAANGKAAAVELLVARGASLEAVDGVGKTPVQRARESGRAGIVAILEAEARKRVAKVAPEMKAAEDEEARKRAAKEAAEKKAAEEEARKRAAKEAAEKKAAEEEAGKMAAKEAAEKKAAEKEARKRAAKEASEKKAAEEEAAQKATKDLVRPLLEEAMRSLRQELTSLRKDFVESSAVKKELDDFKKEIQDKLLAKDQDFAGRFATKQELSKLGEDVDGKLAAVKEDVDSNLSTVKEELQDQINDMQQELAKLREESKKSLIRAKQEFARKFSTKKYLGHSLDAVKEELEAHECKTASELEALTCKATSELAGLREEMATAREHLEYLREDLDRLDQKPAFFYLYKTTDPPTSIAQVEEAVTSIVRANAVQLGAPPATTDAYLDRIRYDSTRKPANMTDVPYYGSRLWTNAEELEHGGVKRTFYGMLADAARRDAISRSSVIVQKAINACLVARLQRVDWPQDPGWVRDHKTWRGAYIDVNRLSFWRDLISQVREDRRRYRAVSPLSTSIWEGIAIGFIVDPAPLGQQKVLFEFQWKSAVDPCVNARYLEPFSTVTGEEEIMLTSFSVMKIEKLEHGSPTDVWDHKIVVSVERDNREWPEYLPFTRWH